jgi:hypothetical protein
MRTALMSATSVACREGVGNGHSLGRVFLTTVLFVLKGASTAAVVQVRTVRLLSSRSRLG